MKIFDIHRFWSKFSKYLDLGQNFRKIPRMVKIFEYLDFGQNFRKKAILVKIRENFKLGHNFRKTSILFETSRFWSKFLKISILVQIF